MNLMLIHGNGGASSRFDLFFDHYQKDNHPGFTPFIPQLPGFEGRSLKDKTSWQQFLEPLRALILKQPDEDWVLYGHGIGGSILLEWASERWRIGPALPEWKPRQVILHAPIGASLSARWFPKLMKPSFMRQLVHWMIYQKWLQKRWERKLFLYPEKIPGALKNQFFEDYKQCEAFQVFFDLITPRWYDGLPAYAKSQDYLFLWGAKERVVASKYIEFWKNDFKQADYQIIEGWDHFPMLDTPGDFYRQVKGFLKK